MPIFHLTDDLIFPSPDLAEENGLLAVGGDLSLKRLLLAYSLGIFPWYSHDSPILWWSPDPRLVLFPGE
ncbi:MAG: leucyl/phenylalanyl-tRNA--protein transferase, partial [Nitrospiraceae bacterium]